MTGAIALARSIRIPAPPRRLAASAIRWASVTRRTPEARAARARRGTDTQSEPSRKDEQEPSRRVVEPPRPASCLREHVHRVLVSARTVQHPRARAPLHDARLADFVGQIDGVTRLAESSPGFVWRLVDEDGSVRPTFGRTDNPALHREHSVWTSLDALRAFVYRGEHVAVMRRRRSSASAG